MVLSPEQRIFIVESSSELNDACTCLAGCELTSHLVQGGYTVYFFGQKVWRLVSQKKYVQY